ncbi:MAG: nucleotidyltransferase domain-containing protein [Solirubrobacteraceae bacterium]
MQVRLLALLLLQPERSWTTNELVAALDAPLASVHREIVRTQDAGLLARDDSVRPHRLSAATNSPLYVPLRDLLQRTVGVEHDLREALTVPGVVAAAIHGSWAGGPRRADSDIDVVVVGDANLRDLRKRTRRVSEQAGRRLDLTLFGLDELKSLEQEQHGFVRHLLQGPLVPLVGDLQEVLRP